MRISKGFALALVGGLAACDVGAGPQMSHVYVRLADAPNPGISAASAWISTIYLIGADGHSRYTITTGPSTEYHLNELSLESGVTALLGDPNIPAGDYAQLRLIVDSAKVTLDGSSFTLKVPSGMETGIKVEFGGPIQIPPPQATIIIDFDVSSSFIVTGPTPPHQVLFKPVLHGTVTE